MTDNQAKSLALFKIIEKEFTQREIAGMLVGALMVVYNDDDIQAIDFLQNRKDFYEENKIWILVRKGAIKLNFDNKNILILLGAYSAMILISIIGMYFVG